MKMHKLNAALIVAVACMLAVPSIAAADTKKKANTAKSNLFMNFGDIKNESTDKDHKDWIMRTNNGPKTGAGGANATKSSGTRH
jgi:hypothetical protein